MSVSGGFRPGGAKGPFVGLAGESPIPTISCSIASGAPSSYIYDPFDTVMGWWDMASGGAAIVDSGFLKPNNVVGTVVNVPLKLNSENPTGAQVVTVINNIQNQRNDGNTRAGGLTIGRVAAAQRFITIGYYNPLARSGVFRIGSVDTTTATGMLYVEALPAANLSVTNYELKVEVRPADVRYYLDGVLKLTEAVVMNLTDATYPIRLKVTDTDAIPQYSFAMDFAMFGYGLPVTC